MLQNRLFVDLLYRIFRITYQFWLEQPDPSQWFIAGEGESPESVAAYGQFIRPLSHASMRMLMEKLETSYQNTHEDKNDAIKNYLEMPDYFQIVNGYLQIADQLEKSKTYECHQHITKLRFLFQVMEVPSLADIHASALR